MISSVRNRPNHIGGFTLIELLVVIALIGVLASVVLLTFSDMRKRARDVVRTYDMDSIIYGLIDYYDKHGSFPCTVQTSLSSNFMDFLVSNGSLSDYPSDPINNPAYFYGYETARETAGGPCGAIAYIWYYTEASENCKFGVQVGDNHCHYFYPKPLNCSDPYLLLEWGGSPDCALLQ